MAQYRKKPIVIEATQWFKNGDHPEDDIQEVEDDETNFLRTDGKIVRRFRRPDTSGIAKCEKCDKIFHIHGWIDTHEGGHIVCPGDWIVTGVQGEHYPCKPDIFEETYDKVSGNNA